MSGKLADSATGPVMNNAAMNTAATGGATGVPTGGVSNGTSTCGSCAACGTVVKYIKMAHSWESPAVSLAVIGAWNTIALFFLIVQPSIVRMKFLALAVMLTAGFIYKSLGYKPNTDASFELLPQEQFSKAAEKTRTRINNSAVKIRKVVFWESSKTSLQFLVSSVTSWIVLSVIPFSVIIVLGVNVWFEKKYIMMGLNQLYPYVAPWITKAELCLADTMKKLPMNKKKVF